MARQTHTAVEAVTYATPDTPAGLTADVANKEEVVMSGDQLLIAYNTGASPYTVTITSVDDAYARSEDIGPVTLAADDFMVWRAQRHGFAQTDGKLHFEANNAAVKFLIVDL